MGKNSLIVTQIVQYFLHTEKVENGRVLIAFLERVKIRFEHLHKGQINDFVLKHELEQFLMDLVLIVLDEWLKATLGWLNLKLLFLEWIQICLQTINGFNQGCFTIKIITGFLNHADKIFIRQTTFERCLCKFFINRSAIGRLSAGLLIILGLTYLLLSIQTAILVLLRA